jgi:hypothetical protein
MMRCHPVDQVPFHRKPNDGARKKKSAVKKKRPPPPCDKDPPDEAVSFPWFTSGSISSISEVAQELATS